MTARAVAPRPRPRRSVASCTRSPTGAGRTRSPSSRRPRSASSSTAALATPAAAPDRRAPGAARASTSSPRSSAPRRPRDASPRRGRGHRRAGARLRGRRRRGDLGPVRAALVRRLGRRPARRPGGRRDPGPRQGVRRRATTSCRCSAPPAPTSSCCSRSSTRPKRLARLVERALDSGSSRSSRRTTSASCERALATDARLIGINNRDLRTLEVDPTRADRLRALVPDDRLVIAESGVREPATVARWRALGFDAALVGEALMRSADPGRGGRARSSAAGRAARRSGQRRAPTVREDLRHHRRGRRAAPRSAPAPTPSGSTSCPARRARWRSTRPPRWPRLARSPRRAAAGRGSSPSPPTPTRGRRRATSSRPSTPTRSSSTARESPASLARSGRDRPGRSLHVPPRTPTVPRRRGEPSDRARAYLAGGRRADPARHGGGPHPGGTGHARAMRRGRGDRPARCRSPWPAAWTPPTSPRPCATIPAVGVDVAVRRRGAARPRGAAAQGPVPRRPVREARQGRPRRPPERCRSARRPSMPACSTPTPPAAGGWSATSAAATCPRR